MSRVRNLGIKDVCGLMALLFLVILTWPSAFGQGLKMTLINPPGSKPGYTVASGVNKSLQVVGTYIVATSGYSQGFLYSAGKYTVLKPPSTYHAASASGINDTGTIVGAYLTSNNRYHGFIYSAGTYTSRRGRL